MLKNCDSNMCRDKSESYFRPWDTEKGTSESTTADLLETDCGKCVTKKNNQRSPSPIINEDFSSTGNLDRLSNFVMNATQEPNTWTPSVENSDKCDHVKRSNDSSSSGASHGSVSPPSALLAPLPASSPTSYWAPITNNSGIISDISLNYPELYRHLASMQVSPNYFQNMEEAVKLLQEQDAAKQMKKLRPKKFRCPCCDTAFSNNGQLKGHIRTHTGERPFKCDFENCERDFTRNEELTRHKKIHTGERPHACHFCAKRFGRKDHLKKHMKTHFLRSGSFGFDESTSAFNIFRRQSGSLLPVMSPLPTMPPPVFAPRTMMPLATSMPPSLQSPFYPPAIISSSSFHPALPIVSTSTIAIPKPSHLAASHPSSFLESAPMMLPSEFSSLPSPDLSSLPELSSPKFSSLTPP